MVVRPHGRHLQPLRSNPQQKTKMNTRLYHCLANGIFGRFGDYIWAHTRGQAEVEFYRQHGAWPSQVSLVRRAA